MRRLLPLLLLLAMGCHEDEADEAPFETRCVDLSACLCETPPCQVDAPTISEAIQVVPAEGLPPQIISQNAHNNLDLVLHDGRLFFVFRTAPSHFASDQTVLYVMSTTDQQTWRYEGAFHEGTDLREPRFLSIGGRLFLFYARLGDDPLAFEPGGARRVEYRGPDDWTPPEPVFDAGFIPWRFQHDGDRALLIGYRGGENIYAGDDPIDVEWLQSRDGLDWQPVAPGHPVVLHGGVSETAFALLPDGGVVAVGRNEAGDERGFGARICRASADALGDWTCRDEPRKFDSPVAFRQGDAVWLIGRRNVTETGAYDLGGEGTIIQRRLRNLADYWVHPKRCALWRVDPEALTVTHVLDLPSAGDTCFASVLPLDADQWLVYDYSSPETQPDLAWMDGQNGP
ncbi:MAG: hypothetical protein KC620_21230, partial [Myxococcales bacterium]|nr:hypothetical protein [Myxococcales bacterium]